MTTKPDIRELLAAAYLRHRGYTRVGSDEHGAALDLADALLAALEAAGLAVVVKEAALKHIRESGE